VRLKKTKNNNHPEFLTNSPDSLRIYFRVDDPRERAHPLEKTV